MEKIENTVIVETHEGFDIFFTPIVDLCDPTENMDKEDSERIMEQINNGDIVHFTAMVTIEKNGIQLSNQYLGSCMYEDFKDFHTKYKSEYFDQMRDEGIKEAKEVISKLIE